MQLRSPWLPEDIILRVPKVTAVPHKYLAEGDPPLCGVKGHLLSTEAASCLTEGRVEVLGRVDLDSRAGLGGPGGGGEGGGEGYKQGKERAPYIPVTGN